MSTKADMRLAPSATYKWGRLTFSPLGDVRGATLWFKTKRAALIVAADDPRVPLAVARFYAQEPETKKPGKGLDGPAALLAQVKGYLSRGWL
jgi:hypothetical protein